MLKSEIAVTGRALWFEAGATAGGNADSSRGDSTSARNNATEPAAFARDTNRTCRRRGASDVAPSRSSITSAQVVGELLELRHGERARGHLEHGVVLDPADRARAVYRECRLRRAAPHPQRRGGHGRLRTAARLPPPPGAH